MISYKYFITHPKALLLGIMTRTASLWPDKTYIRIVYYLSFGRKLNLKKPISLTEKINWLKVNCKDPSYSNLVDKYEVKNYVKSKVGDDIIIPTLGVWDSFNDIDFDKLPQKFVLKTTNGGGNTSVVICRDKNSLDIESCRHKLQLQNSKKIYMWSREYPYYTVKPRIIAEEFIETPNNELSDYKFFCFNGIPHFLFVGTERQKAGEEVKFDFFDSDFIHLAVKNGHENSNRPIPKPKNFDQMLNIASKLSEGIPNVRIDLYNVDGQIYFGEITLFHFGGFVPFSPDEWDYKFGQMLELPKP